MHTGYTGYGRKSEIVPCRLPQGDSAQSWQATANRIAVIVAGVFVTVIVGLYFLLQYAGWVG